MNLNAVTGTVLWDKDYDVTLLITGGFSAANSSNTVVLHANTVMGANASMNCILDVIGVQYASSIANGFVSLEWANGTSNTTFAVYGKLAGRQEAYIRANTAWAYSDINVNVYNAAPNDSFTLILSLRKADFNGAYSNVANPWNSPPYSINN